MVGEVARALSAAAGTNVPVPAAGSAGPVFRETGPGAVPAGEPLIEFEHVCFSYEPSARERARRGRRRRDRRDGGWGGGPDDVWALADVTLAVRRGELLGIAGHTGSGKSTLIQHMNGLEHPMSGAVRAFGRDLADKRAAAETRRRVGVVFQYPEHQLFAQTVFEDVAFGPRNLGVPEGEVEGRVRGALQAVGLAYDDVAGRSPFSLSGGQQRRCAFAGVLAMRPEVLVLDEATAMLDPRGRREVLSVVERLHRERGMTVVMITQYMEEVAPCDRVVVMDGGRIALAGTPRQIFRDPDALRAAGLDTPEAVQMRDALTRGGVPLQGDPITIEELADAICQSLSNN